MDSVSCRTSVRRYVGTPDLAAERLQAMLDYGTSVLSLVGAVRVVLEIVQMPGVDVGFFESAQFQLGLVRIHAIGQRSVGAQ